MGVWEFGSLKNEQMRNFSRNFRQYGKDVPKLYHFFFRKFSDKSGNDIL